MKNGRRIVRGEEIEVARGEGAAVGDLDANIDRLRTFGCTPHTRLLDEGLRRTFTAPGSTLDI